ncbi:hypothetical protein AMTR_s00055p00214120 [Amborella trichopoda]|uniref:Uncharacterized protein n=1 Tax=Amborella trichopoda TaxID=13333 RepID=U5D7Z4_AMBTC|nr:hypothetical protein AMTR_s00055p00214120 [Amborella trichopoda]
MAIVSSLRRKVSRRQPVLLSPGESVATHQHRRKSRKRSERLIWCGPSDWGSPRGITTSAYFLSEGEGTVGNLDRKSSEVLPKAFEHVAARPVFTLGNFGGKRWKLSPFCVSSRKAVVVLVAHPSYRSSEEVCCPVVVGYSAKDVSSFSSR